MAQAPNGFAAQFMLYYERRMVPKGRFELPCPCGHLILNQARLPFRHFGARMVLDALCIRSYLNTCILVKSVHHTMSEG